MPRRRQTQRNQLRLFDGLRHGLPEGFKYRTDLLSATEERELVERITLLPFEEFQFHGFLGKRRVVSFGRLYDFSQQELRRAESIPSFLLPMRERAARFGGVLASELEQALVTEYRPGAAIGWHKDKSVFGSVIGISLVSPSVFRFRRKLRTGWERASFVAEPRSAYLLTGPARTDWEHSIPGVDSLRYSITFRTLRMEK
jgi:alkylated DNA repair dioxygenase AlkB